ncbi:hypothetical protein D1BOALGB6SA_8678, partial [Olavius sp. associated proteobacterium Delta 1]
AAGAEMQAGVNPKNITRLFDIYDDNDQGTVYYSQWLTEPVVLPETIVSNIIAPVDGSAQKSRVLQIEGIAVSPAGVSYVEVSIDGGDSWYRATGARNWHYDWEVPADGTYTFDSRAVYTGADGDLIEVPTAQVTVTVDSSLPTTTGLLTGDEAWSGEILLTGDVTVPAGVTLTIEPGTTARFLALNDDQGSGSNGSRAELIVRGALVAEGTAEQPIVFTSSSSDPNKGDWYGIRLVADANDASISLDHCTVAYAAVGVAAAVAADTHNVVVNIAHCTIHQTSSHGIHVSGQMGSRTTIDIAANNVMYNDGHGIYFEMRNPATQLNGSITDNEISNNGGYGLYVYGWYKTNIDLVIDGNLIEANQNYGIYLYTWTGYDVRTYFTVSNNRILASGTGIYCYAYRGPMTVTISDNEIANGSDGIYCRSDVDSSS